MPSSNLIKLWEETLVPVQDAAGHLYISYERCKSISSLVGYSENELIELEAYTRRFARLCDLITQKLLKTIERLDSETPGTVRDRINNSEKKGIVPSAETLLEIRDVRNTIAHDYEGESFAAIISFAVSNTPVLLTITELAKEYCIKFK
ncbi:MAG: hypothetical protein LH619_12140 [Chitinophagaceae bacterium]|nr:hypothetical protein [Chitinophagaceae bacterium]